MSPLYKARKQAREETGSAACYTARKGQSALKSPCFFIKITQSKATEDPFTMTPQESKALVAFKGLCSSEVAFGGSL